MWHRLKLPPDQFSCLLSVERVQVRKAREPRVLGGAGGSVLIGRRERIRILVMPGSEPVADIVYCHDAKCRPVRISGRGTRAERPTGATRRRRGASVMSQKIRVQVVDDLDGSSPAAETIQFAYEGRRFEIDLSQANAASFRAMMSEYADRARRAQLRPDRRPRAGSDRLSAAEVRQWALAQGISVSSAGRIPTRIMQAYDESHSRPKPAVTGDNVPAVTFKPPVTEATAQDSRKRRSSRPKPAADG